MNTGKVKLHKKDEGYGVITPDDGSRDILFREIRCVGVELLAEGRRVSYKPLSHRRPLYRISRTIQSPAFPSRPCGQGLFRHRPPQRCPGPAPVLRQALLGSFGEFALLRAPWI